MYRDIAAALGLLTRLPVPDAPAPRAQGVWAWPLAGLVVGCLSVAAGAVTLGLGLPSPLAAIAVLVTGALATGGLHEDGLADCADGFWGGMTRPRRLEIMKDSRIGSYGVLALILVTLLRWQAVAALLEAGAWGSVLAGACLSRAPMAVLAAAMPNARPGGLSAAVGRPSVADAAACAGLALVLALAVAGLATIPMAIATALAALAVALIARAKIGGQTGDVLGASQQLCEAVALATATAWIAS